MDNDITLSDYLKTNKVKGYVSNFVLSDDTIISIQKLMAEEVDTGLKQKEVGFHNTSSISMGITFFTELFDGSEKGNFVVIHLNKHHLLLALVQIQPGFSPDIKSQYFIVSENTRESPYIGIFDFLCDCLLKFFNDHNLINETQIIAFCSDFPVIQLGINDGTFCYFTQKASDFPLNCYDLIHCFDITLKKPKYKDIKIDIAAIISENTSMLVASAYSFANVDMFVNFDNDCDILYWEDKKHVKKWENDDLSIEKVLIDTELRNFGGTGCLDFISTDYDWDVVSQHINTSIGKYCNLSSLLQLNSILDLLKHVLLVLHHDLLYCRNSNMESLQKNGIAPTELFNLLNSKSLDHALVLLPGGTIGGSKDDAKIAIFVCKAILIRSAQMKSICLATFLSRLPSEDITVVIKSSLFWKLPDYETTIRNSVKLLVPEKKIQFLPPSDSCITAGTALAAAIISHKKNREKLHL